MRIRQIICSTLNVAQFSSSRASTVYQWKILIGFDRIYKILTKITLSINDKLFIECNILRKNTLKLSEFDT